VFRCVLHGLFVPSALMSAMGRKRTLNRGDPLACFAWTAAQFWSGWRRQPRVSEAI